MCNLGNVSDVLLKFYHIKNQYNTKKLPCYFPCIHHREKSFLSL